MIANISLPFCDAAGLSADENGSKRQECRSAKPRCISSRRRLSLIFTYTLLAIILMELVLPNLSLIRPTEAKKKKKIMKKIKEILPLIALLKRKKIVLLPIPM